MNGAAPEAVLALDLGGTQIRAAVVRGDGSVHHRAATPTPVAEGSDAIVAACVRLVATVRAAFDSSGSGRDAPVAGLGISAPGPVDPFRGVVVDPPNLGPGFREVPLAALVAEASGLLTVLDRDTQVAAMAEGEFGAARGCRDFLYLTVSTGIGGAVVSDGRLLRGPDGGAGELGHVLVDRAGPPCGCGAAGHLEAVASGVAIARAGRQAIARGESELLERLAEETGERFGAREIARAEEAGDPAAGIIMRDARDAFAAACVGFVDVFNPDLIVVGGSLACGQGERWLHPARDAVARLGSGVPPGGCASCRRPSATMSASSARSSSSGSAWGSPSCRRAGDGRSCAARRCYDYRVASDSRRIRAARLPEASGSRGGGRGTAARTRRRGDRRPGVRPQALLRRQEQRGRPPQGRPARAGRAAVDARRALPGARSRSSSPCRSSSARRRRRSSARPRRCSGSTPTTATGPIARHAIYVLESIDAIDLAFDTFVCTLLDGETDTSGYPEYNAIVGGVASPLGRGDRRHDRPGDRRAGAAGASAATLTGPAAQLLGGLLRTSWPASTRSASPRSSDRSRPPGRGGLVCAHCGFASGHERAFYCPKCGMRLLRG